MTFRVSLSHIFKERIAYIKEVESYATYKRVANNIKSVAKNLEDLERRGITIHEMIIKSQVPTTRYAIVYKVKIDPKKKIIAKKIIRHK